MDSPNICPVPNKQIPTEELKQLYVSWFFSWPTKDRTYLYKSIFICWLIALPISTIIATGSWTLRNDRLNLAFVSVITSMGLPLISLIRQWLGWSYIYRRLISPSIDYEETGWYDGQTWNKPKEWIDRDNFIAINEVKPKIILLLDSFVLMLSFTLLCIFIYFYLQN